MEHHSWTILLEWSCNSFHSGSMWAFFFCAAVEADVISYNSSISSCEKAGHWKEALCLFVDLLEQHMNFGCKRVKGEGCKVAVIFVSNTSLSCGETWVSWDGYEYEWSTVMIAWFETHTSYQTPMFQKSHKPPYCFKSHVQICLRKVTTITFNSAMSACEKNNKHSAVQKLFLMMHQHKVEPDRPPVDVFSLMFFGFFSADIDVFLPAWRQSPIWLSEVDHPPRWYSSKIKSEIWLVNLIWLTPWLPGSHTMWPSAHVRLA